MRFAVGLTAVLCIAGLAGIPRAGTQWYTAWGLFFEQFARVEGPSLLLILGCLAALLFALREPGAGEPRTPRDLPYRSSIVAGMAAVAAVIALCGIRWLFRDFLMADDEFSGWFQAQLFAHGRFSAAIPAQWCPYAGPITPTSIVTGADCRWHLSYFPIHSLFQAPFIALGISRFGVPFATALSIWLTADIARKLWPDRPARAYIAAIAMATSVQVLFMSMTMFSMATHLLSSMVFLRLYISDRRAAKIALPWVGVLALGVHSPMPHLLFAPPFILRFARDRRWKMFAYVVVVYVAGVAFWATYLQQMSATPSAVTAGSAPSAVAAGATGLWSYLRFPNEIALFTARLHIALIPTWNNPLLVVLVAAAMLSWKRLDTFSRDAALSVLFTIVVRIFLQTLQGEGWGYRMIYANLGCIALLAAVGADTLFEAVGRRRATQLLVASTAIALFVQLPMRVRDVGRIMGPYRDGHEWLNSFPNEVVVFPSQTIAWGRQLVQNDPFLRNRPILMDSHWMSAESLRRLGADSTGRGRVKLVTRSELRAHGLPPGFKRVGPFLVEE